MTTRIELTYRDEVLVVIGDYIKAERPYFDPVLGIGSPGYPSEFRIERVEQDGHDVTMHYHEFLLIPMLEDMARELIESD